MYAKNKELTSIEGFLRRCTSLSAIDSDDGDSVLFPGLQTVEGCAFSFAGYILGIIINFNLVRVHVPRHRSLPGDSRRAYTGTHGHAPRYVRF